MKEKRTAQLPHRVASTRRISVSAFANLCILLGLLVFFTGILVALFAAGNPPSFVYERTRDVSDRFSHSNGAPPDPAASVYQAWVAHYHDSGDDSDFVVAMAADESGNVYVTGYGSGSATGWDFATVKYNSVGEKQWVVRYNGPDNEYDRPYAMAIDSFGNAYVTGYSGTADSFTDWTTIKYNSEGREQRVARYNVCPRSYARGRSIAVDGSGNVYVTGNDGSLWAVIKYNSSGEEQWVTHHNAGESIAVAVDNVGNIYVTGDDYDYVTIKYDSSGQEQWLARYNGPGNAEDRVAALALDLSENVYLTGASNLPGTYYEYANTVPAASPDAGSAPVGFSQ